MYLLIITLAITILIEFLVIWLFLRGRLTEILLYSTLINCLTLPLATYGYNYLVHNLVLIEVLVILAESLLIMLLFKIKYTKALLISAVANLVTALVGFLLF